MKQHEQTHANKPESIMKSIYLTTVTTMLLCIAGCGQEVSVPAPVHAGSPRAMPERSSTIVAPISVDLLELQKRLNAQLPTKLVALDQDQDACIPAQWAVVCPVPKVFRRGCAVREIKTKITPEIDCHLDGWVERGPLSIDVESGALKVTLPLYASVTARGRGDIGKHIQETAKGSIIATATVTADLNEQWQPVVDVIPSYEWGERAYLRVLGIRITIGSKVDPEIDKAMVRLKSEVSDALSKLSVRGDAEKAWRHSAMPIRLADDPAVWFRFQPKEVGFSGLQATPGKIKASLMVRGLTQTFVGAAPGPGEPGVLPPLRKRLPSAGFNIYLPVFVDYSAASAELAKALQVGAEQTIRVPKIGDVKTIIEEVQVYPAADDSIAVGLKMRADPPGQLLDTKGTVWIKARISVDNASKRIVPIAIDYGAETDNTALGLLFSIARAPAIKRKVEKALAYDFGDKYADALRDAARSINRDLGGGLRMEASIDKAAIEGLKASKNGVYLGLEVSGNIRLLALTPQANASQ